MSDAQHDEDAAPAVTDPDAPPKQDGQEFLVWLMRYPALIRELSEAQRELGRQVQETGRKGAITLKLSLKPHPRIERMVETTSSVDTSKVPTAQREHADMVFIGEGGELLAEDPNAPQFRYPMGGDGR